jgi:hypothetical protein
VDFSLVVAYFACVVVSDAESMDPTVAVIGFVWFAWLLV